MKQRGHLVDLLFTLTLLCVFAVGSFLVVLTGANVYNNIVEKDAYNDEMRTSLLYVTEKIHRQDAGRKVTVGDFEGTQALILEQTWDGQAYQTILYHDEGWLKELYIKKGTQVDRSLGEKIVEIPQFSFAEEEDLLILTAQGNDGRRERLPVYLRSQGEEA